MNVFSGLFGLLEASVLFVNAVAILSEERFLAPIGWSSAQAQAQAQAQFQQPSYQQPYADPASGFGVPGGGQDVSVKVKLISLIGAVRTLMRIPLIGLNLIFILFELVWGQ
ncbi:Yos1-like protein [Exidia glandulosa HHB12029]|uniref:Yos1-like protein n=1 Tax=Exidia glandulosa HHB12029 TaxID=1314781 RepID=A0A165BSV0_EXIGL|nr:Yos1-like protein [Exidia glandulosa HHB12029]